MPTVNLDNLSKDALAALLVDEVDGLNKTKAREILNALFGTNEGGGLIGSALKRGSSVTITGFGKFYPVAKPAVKARKGIDPFSKEERMFKAKPASVAVKFRAGKATKEYVSGAKKK